MTSTGPETSETPGATTQRHGFGIDVGGSGIKGGIVDLDTGQLIGDRIKLLTPQPATPLAVAKTIAEVVNGFGWRGPLGVTYPGVVTHGVVRTAANVDKSWIGPTHATLSAPSWAVSRSPSSTTLMPPGWPRHATGPARTTLA